MHDLLSISTNESLASFYEEDVFIELGSIDGYQTPKIIFGFTFAYSGRTVDIIHFKPCKAFCSFLFFNNFTLDKNCKINQNV